MSATDYFLGGLVLLVLLVLAAVSPFVYEQATADVPRVDADYWLERGYAPLEVVFPAGVPDEK